MPSLAQLETAADLVHAVVPPTPQIAWPVLAARVGADLWVKHENHTPIGAFKIRGGLADLDTVYVPIGLGSGICGIIAARDALGLGTRIVGVVASGAPAYALSFAAGRPVSTNSADTMADGLACRVPAPPAIEIILKGAERIVTVEDGQIRAAMRHLFTDTHNVAEGAGAATLAALLQEKDKMA